MALFSWAPDITLTTSSGLSFITDSAALNAGRVADKTRMQWLVSATPATSQFESITGNCTPAITPRCAALLMPIGSLALPAGVKVVITAFDASNAAVALGGNSATQRTQLLPNGAVAIWWIFGKITTPIAKFVISIYNDCNGSTWLVQNQYFDLGQTWCGDGADFRIEGTPDDELQGGVQQRRSHNNQSQAYVVAPYRSFLVKLVPMSEVQMFGPNSAQADFETVRYNIATAKRAVLIPSYFNPNANPDDISVVDSTTISVQRLHRSARLGLPDSTIKISGYGQKQYSVASFTWGESAP